MTSEFGKAIKICLVENNPLDCRIIQELLVKSSIGRFDLTTVTSLQETLNTLKSSESFDLLILDLNLTDSEGLDTLTKIHSRFPDLPIVVNTGAFEDELGLRSLSLGAQDFLIKGKYETYGLVKSLYFAIERKKNENELRTAYARLKEFQDQLIQAEKMHAVGILASGVAHEVRNPLATILYGIEYLQKKITSVDPHIPSTLVSIQLAAQRANSIIGDLLDFSSLSQLNKSPEDLHKIIDTCLSLLKHHIEKFHIQIQKEPGSDIPLVTVDKNRIEQVCLNLLLNAIQAMPEGGVLKIRLQQKTLSELEPIVKNNQGNLFQEGDQSVVIEIEDTGSGIPDDILPRIFEPFFTTKEDRGGVGLGLSISKNILQHHQGILEIQNNEKQKGVIARLFLKTEG